MAAILVPESVWYIIIRRQNAPQNALNRKLKFKMFHDNKSWHIHLVTKYTSTKRN